MRLMREQMERLLNLRGYELKRIGDAPRGFASCLDSAKANGLAPKTVFDVGVGYGTEIAHARQVMVDAVRAQDWVMKDERIEALFHEFGDSAIIFRVRCWIEHYVETRRIIDQLNTCLYDALNEAGIVMPDPIRTLYHRVDPADRDGLVAVLREARR